MGPPMTPEEEAAHYLFMQQADPRTSYRDYFRPKLEVDVFWTSDFACLKEIVTGSRPDMIVADFFVDAARDIMYQKDIPLALVWPQMPYGVMKASYIPGVPGFQIDTISSEHASVWTRMRAELRPIRAIPAMIEWTWFVRKMRRAAGVNYSLPLTHKPDYLALVNSFWGVETPKDLPPLMNAVGPILADEYPPLTDAMEAFFATHQRVVYVSFGTHVQLQPHHLDRFLSAFSELLRENLIDGVIWAANGRQQMLFPLNHRVNSGTHDVLVSDIIYNRDPAWYFTLFAPQRAILDRPETVLFVTHGGGSSINEAMYHGTKLLSLGFFFDQPLNGLRIQEAGVGLALDKASFTADEIVSKCRTILVDEDGAFAQDVQRMKHIARVSSRKKYYAADLIEEVLYDRMYSLDVRKTATGVRKRRPWHLQTADARMSVFRAKNIDLTCLGAIAVVGTIGLGYYGHLMVVSRWLGSPRTWWHALKMLLPASGASDL